MQTHKCILACTFRQTSMVMLSLHTFLSMYILLLPHLYRFSAANELTWQCSSSALSAVSLLLNYLKAGTPMSACLPPTPQPPPMLHPSSFRPFFCCHSVFPVAAVTSCTSVTSGKHDMQIWSVNHSLISRVGQTQCKKWWVAEWDYRKTVTVDATLPWNTNQLRSLACIWMLMYAVISLWNCKVLIIHSFSKCFKLDSSSYSHHQLL